MKANYNIVAVAIALVVSGAVSYQSACIKCEQIADELCTHESENLRQELAVMKECVALFSAQDEAINDWREEA